MTMTLEQVRDDLRELVRDASIEGAKAITSCIPVLEDWAEAIDAHLREREAAKAGVTEAPVVIEAVGCVEFNAAGELDIDWLIEGGICELGAGTILLVADRKVTDDEGYGELYVAPMLASARVPEISVAMVREADHLCPTDLPHMDKLRWKAAKLN